MVFSPMLSHTKWLVFLAVTTTLIHAQANGVNTKLEQHGTCSVTASAPFGMAFIIDSRVTQTDSEGHIVSQSPGCKVLLARPTVLLAGIGLEDTTGRAGHWNSLDAASAALKTLPENPTVAQLDDWSDRWATTLWNHFRQGGETPIMLGELADIILITKIGDEPYYRRTNVNWDGTHFDERVDPQDLDRSKPYVRYAGACRDFVTVFVAPPEGKGHFQTSRVKHTSQEQQRLDLWGFRKTSAQSVSDLATSIYGLESVLTDIDTRLHGDRAVIAPPYATADWPEDEKGWRTQFNAECLGPSGPSNGH